MRLPASHGAAWRGVISVALACAWLGSAAAQTVPSEDIDRRFVQPPLTLPETLRGKIEATGRATAPGPVDTIRDIFPAISACWAPPAGLTNLETFEVTVRFSLRRDGALVGAPRITFATHGAESRARQLFTDASLEAILLCTPLKIMI